MKEAALKLSSNLVLWTIFILSFIFYFALKNDLSWDGVIPNSEFKRLISYEVIIIQVISAFVLFGIFALFTHKAKNNEDVSHGKNLMDIALGEWSSILFNFGSLNLMVGFILREWASLIVAVICYVIGLIVFPKESNTAEPDTKSK
jgi:hypothetical protein